MTVEVGDFTQSRPRLQRIRAKYRIHAGFTGREGNQFVFPKLKLVEMVICVKLKKEIFAEIDNQIEKKI